jgi:site-specific DNA-methyltransferase (adenine-specific)
MIVLARKPLSEKTVAANVLKWGTGALNIDGCRVSGDISEMTGRSGRSTPNQVWGEGIGHDEMWSPNKTGRWPANLIHDGSEEVVVAFPESESSGSGFRPAGSNRGSDVVYAQDEYSQTYQRTEWNGPADSGSAARFFYTSKADSDDRVGSKHPTVKPLDLIQYLVRLITPRGGTCLDPFAGTGTTGEAAFREGKRAVLIEREAEYQADIRRRMALVLAGPDERVRESIKARGLVDDNPGPLFEWNAE